MGHLPALPITPANEQDRTQVAALAERIQAVIGEMVEVAFVHQGFPGSRWATDAAAYCIRLEVAKPPEAKRGFVLLPRRWFVERGFGWMAWVRRQPHDYVRPPLTLAGLQFLASALSCSRTSTPLRFEFAWRRNGGVAAADSIP